MGVVHTVAYRIIIGVVFVDLIKFLRLSYLPGGFAVRFAGLLSIKKIVTLVSY